MNGTSGDGLPARLATLVARATDQARRTGAPVLVSATEEIAAVDPLAALECATSAADDDPAIESLVASARMFWSHAPSEIAFAAVGAAAVIAPSRADRFGEVDRQWRALHTTAIVEGSHDGPVLCGGFAFDDGGDPASAWAAFPCAHFVVPALRVASHRAAHVLTVCLLVHADGSLSTPPATLLRLREIMLGVRHVAIGELPAAVHVDTITPAQPVPLRPDDAWRALVHRALVDIHAGALRKVVLARGERASEPAGFDVIAALAHLRSSHPGAYVFAYWREHSVFLGATPERLVRLRDRVVDASSLAGSAARGGSTIADRTAADRLLHSAKDLAEHALVLAALREALVLFADDVVADETPSLVTLPNVHHLHTAVRATLRDGHSLLDVAAALHPTPAVGGAPRAEALAFIRAHECLGRGWYAAPIGWIGREDGELAVALRSALVTGPEAVLFAGCGIVAASDPEAELRESRLKLRAMEAALAVAARAAVQPSHASLGAGCR